MKENRFKINLLDYDDIYLDSLVEIIFDAYKRHPEYGEPTIRSAKNYIKWLKRHSTFFKIAKVDGEIAGFIVADSNWRDGFDNKIVGEIHEISVKRKFWGHGIGTFMIKEVLNHFKKSGRNIVRLWVGKKNKEAISFYKNLGFKILYERWEWLRMEKRL